MFENCIDSDEQLLLRRRIYYLETEIRDCIRTGNELINYYERDEENEQAYSA